MQKNRRSQTKEKVFANLSIVSQLKNSVWASEDSSKDGGTRFPGQCRRQKADRRVSCDAFRDKGGKAFQTSLKLGFFKTFKGGVKLESMLFTYCS